MADVICQEYESSLRDLTFNSKPHISMLTMLAEENSQYAPQIVKVIEAHLQKVKAECKLPTMYLIDSVVKNVGNVYLSLFMQNMVSNFCTVFEKVDEKVRMQLFKLRQTWSDIFPNKKLYAIDVRVKQIDPAWPITAQAPPQPSIHVNPKFLKPAVEEPVGGAKVQDVQEEEMRKQLLAKQQELLKLQRQKLELELLQTQVVVEEQKRQLYLKEQQMLRVQQKAQEEVQRVQQLTAALAVSAGPSGPEAAKENATKADQPSGSPSGSFAREQRLPTTVRSSSPKKGLNSTLLTTQTVITLPIMVTNKAIDTNSFANKGPVVMDSVVSATSSTAKSKPSSIDSASAKAFPTKTSESVDIKHAAPGVLAPCISVAKQGSSGSSRDGSKDKTASAKSSPKDTAASSKADAEKKGRDSGKNLSPSPKKRQTRKETGSSRTSSSSKEKTDSSRSSSRKKDEGSSAKGSSKTSSKSSVTNSSSTSPTRGKEKTDQRRSSSRGHSRSPGSSNDKDERPSKRSRRSPHKDKENTDTRGVDDGKKTKSFSFSHKADVDLRTSLEVPLKHDVQGTSLEKASDGEPPVKKNKGDDSELDDIFSGKDQDYRQLGRPVPRLSPIGENSWAQYKASRPDEFKNPLRPRDNVDPFGFGNQDLDLRTPGMMRGGGGGGHHHHQPWGSRDPRMSGFRDPRMRRNDVRPYGSRLPPHMLPQQHVYQATQESDPNIPRALMFDRGADIMRQADQQLKSGQLTLEQHAELMEQLAKLYELQRMRHLQREQQAFDKVMLHRKLSHEEPNLGQMAPKNGGGTGGEGGVTPMELDDAPPAVGSDSKEDCTPPKEFGILQKPVVEEGGPQQQQRCDARKGQEPMDVVDDADVIVIDDDHQMKEKQLPKYEGKRRGSRWSSPVQQQQPMQHRPVPNTVMIDDKPREVRFCDGKAVVVLDNEDIREIGFRGPPQDVMFDERVIRMGFGNMIKEFEVDGHLHTMRFGAPTREILVDDVPYAAVFGGPPIVVVLHGTPHDLRLSGPTPEVFFGDQPRCDLLYSLRQMAGNKPQPCDVRKEHLMERSPPRSGSPMRWVTSTIGRDYEGRDWKSSREGWHGPPFHEEPYSRGPYHAGERRPHDEPWMREEEYRGPPPHGGMGGGRGSGRMHGGHHGGSPQMDDYFDSEARNSPYRDGPDQRPSGGFYNRDVHFRGSFHGGPQGMCHRMPVQRHRFEGPGPGPMNHFIQPPPSHGQPMRPPAMVQYPVPFGYRNPPTTAGAPPNFPPPSAMHNNFNFSPNAQHLRPPAMVPPPPMSVPPACINVSELFSKLVATGIIPQVSATMAENKMDVEGASGQHVKPADPLAQQLVMEKIPPIELAVESLKVRHSAVISVLYCGIQCSSCGVRFTCEQTDKYAQHLDWHFRQNRREKDSARKALSRKWYYDIQDYVQFEEIEDLEERARSFFELQANDDNAENADESAPSVSAGESEEDKKCYVCHELFELYWDEDHEEWHFRDAMRHEDKNCHPLCYVDIKGKPTAEEGIDEAVGSSDASQIEPSAEETGAISIKAEVNGKEEVEVSVKTEVVEGETSAEKMDATPAESVNPVESGTDDVDKIAVQLDGAVVIKEEPRDSEMPDDMAEPSGSAVSEQNPEEPESSEALSIFNVLSSTCLLPPLIGMEPEMELEVKAEPETASENGLEPQITTKNRLEEEIQPENTPIPETNKETVSETTPEIVESERKAEPETESKPSEPETESKPSEPEMESESKPSEPETESESKPSEPETESESKPSEPEMESETKPSETELERKPSEPETEPIMKLSEPEMASETMPKVRLEKQDDQGPQAEIGTAIEASERPEPDVTVSEKDEAVIDKAVYTAGAVSQSGSVAVVDKPDHEMIEPQVDDFVKSEPIAAETVVSIQGNVTLQSSDDTPTEMNTETGLGLMAVNSENVTEEDEKMPPLLVLEVPVEGASCLSAPTPKEEEDISLKESSDVILDFAFDQPSTPQASVVPEKSEGENLGFETVGAPDDDSNEAEDIDLDQRFKILPPVMRGTELSGLCSIM